MAQHYHNHTINWRSNILGFSNIYCFLLSARHFNTLKQYILNFCLVTLILSQKENCVCALNQTFNAILQTNTANKMYYPYLSFAMADDEAINTWLATSSSQSDFKAEWLAAQPLTSISGLSLDHIKYSKAIMPYLPSFFTTRVLIK